MDVLRTGYSMRIGSGDSSFWFDSWITLGPLCALVDFVDIQDTQLSVKDIRSSYSWDFNRLATVMLLAVREGIQNTHMHIRDDVTNALVWEENVRGNHTTSDGYGWVLKQRNPTPNACNWGWIWSMKGLENVKFLCWLACHDSIPTNNLLYHHGILQHSGYQRCMLGEEGFLHSIRDCPSSRRLWEVFGYTDNKFFQDMDVTS